MAKGTSRDLTFSVLSDSDRFDLGDAAGQLEDLGASAKDAGTGLDTFATDANASGAKVETAMTDMALEARRRLDDVDTAARGLDLERRLGDPAKAAARKVDTAFEAIARASRTSSRKVDTETRDMRESIDDVGQEASDTAREMGASFSSGGDIADGMQELAANAGVYFGPIGTALGIAGAIGVGLFRAETEKLKTRVDELVEYMKEAGGKLDTAAIDDLVSAPENRDELQRLKELATASDIAGVSFRDLARAKVGDEDAAKRLAAALETAEGKYKDTLDAAGNYNGVNDLMRARIKVLRQEMGEGTKALELAKEATTNLGDATAPAAEDVAYHAATAGGAWDDLRANLGRPIKARVVANAPTAEELNAVRGTIQRRIGTIPVQLRVAGQSQFANTGDNSRYRW